VSDPGRAAAGGVFAKERADAPEGFFAAEAAGLAWLAEAVPAGGAAVVEVLEVSRSAIRLRHLRATAPAPAAAEAFGRALAVTHAAGAPGHGCGPPGAGGRGWIGPLALPASGPRRDGTAWGPFFAGERLHPFLRLARDRGAVDAAGARVLAALIDRIGAGEERLTGPPEPVARLHGDLWSGNLLWTAAGAVLIDPSAHGGHRESDLAMLALFGQAHLDRVLAAYDEARPLAPGWRDRVGVHQLYPLLVHAALFGEGYGTRAVAVARGYG